MIDYLDPIAYVLNETPKTTGVGQSDNFNINVLDALKAIYDLLVGVAEFVNAEDAIGPLFKPGAGLNFTIQLADAAGARKVQVKDSGGVVVFEVDSDGNLIALGVGTVSGLGTGGVTDYDLNVGDTDGSPTYGIIRLGDAIIGRTSYKAGNIDLDGAILFRNNGGPVTSEIEFIFAESTDGTARFALPKGGIGNATYNPRSMLIAGPAPADTDFVKVSYWQAQGIFHNLACDTDGDGADVGIQNDLEVEGDIFVDSMLESTPNAGITAEGVLFKDNEATFRLPLVTKSGAYTASVGDKVILCNAASGAFTITLPAASTSSGVWFHIKKIDASGNAVTVDGSGAETIDGNFTFVLGPYDAIKIICDGSNWHIL